MAIGMKLSVNLRMGQKLVMTPMLQQAIKLLPLTRLELAQQVRQEIMENPVLEEAQEDEELIDEKDNKEGAQTTKPTESFDVPQKDEPTPDSPDVDWDTYFQENIDRGMSAENYIEQPSLETTYKKDPSLSDHLLWQLNLSVNNDREKFIGTCIIGNIQGDGYLRAEISDLCEISQGSEEEVLNILKTIQGFEPNGVGGRCLKECLAIQAQSDPSCPPLVLKLIENHLEWLEERYFPKLASNLKVPIKTLIDAIKKIRGFDPKPGLSWNSERIDYVVPDIFVVNSKEGYDVALNDEGIPQDSHKPLLPQSS